MLREQGARTTGARTTSTFVPYSFVLLFLVLLFLQKVPPRARSYLAGLVGMTAPFEGGGVGGGFAAANPFFPTPLPSFRVKRSGTEEPPSPSLRPSSLRSGQAPRSGTEEPPSPVIATPSASLGAAFILLFLIYRSKDNFSLCLLFFCSFVLLFLIYRSQGLQAQGQLQRFL
jgi:hypothetical protein